MIRKSAILLTVVAVIFALMPPLAASAAVSTTASIITPREVFPTIPGEAKTPVTVRVTNPQGSLLDFSNPLPGNAVRLVPPPGVNAPACATTPQGWDCQVVTTPNATFLLFDTVSNPLQRGQSLDFGFTATIGAPGNADRSGALQVSVSDDLGQSFENSQPASNGALTLVTKILQIVPGTLETRLLGATAARTRTTEGQVLEARFTVRNFAFNEVTVTPALGGVSSPDSASAPAALTVPGQRGTAIATFQVTTGDANALSRILQLTGSAASGTSSSNVAQFPPVTIEQAVRVVTDVVRFAPRVIPDAQTQNFRLTVDKPQLPGVDGLQGSLVLTRQNGGGSLAPIALANPQALARNPQANVALLFQGVNIDLGLVGTEARLDGSLTITGTDDNGKPFTQTINLPNLLTVDALAPVITLNPLQILNRANGQTRANDGNTVRITGRVADADVTRQNQPNSTTSGVTVQVSTPNTTITVPVTIANDGSFTGDVPIAQLGAADRFGTLTASARARDLAGNIGDSNLESIEFDRVIPALAENGIAILDDTYDTKPVVRVSFVEQFPEPFVRGGCLPTMWEVDNAVVTDVRYEDGTRCQIGQAGPSNVRVLILDRAINPERAGSVDFISTRNIMGIGDDPVRDSAVNTALSETKAIVSGVAPTIPTILDITRTDIVGGERESMGFRDDSFFTNVAVTPATGLADPTVKFDPANIINDYVIEILDGAGQLVASASADEGNRDVRNVPINACPGACEATTTLFAQLVNEVIQNGQPVRLVSPQRPFTITYDTVIPRIDNATLVDGGVRVDYNEPLISGRDAASDWVAFERNENRSPEESEFFAYGVNGVSIASPSARLLSVEFGMNGPFAGVDFFSLAEQRTTAVYRDFAGNYTDPEASFFVN
jgi:hypothetical protein